MSTLPPPSEAPIRGAKDCPICRGEGYRVAPKGEFAWAERCECVPPCPRCGGTGRVALERDGLTMVGRCRCQRLVDRIARFNHASLPARYADATFVSFSQGAVRIGDGEKTRALIAVRKWLAGFASGEENLGLLMYGPVGRGKTHLLVALLRELVFDAGVQVRFIEFSRLLSLLKEGYSAGRSDAGLLGELATVPVLGIDEVGKGRLTSWELGIIDEVVSRRYNAMTCTIVTTNYPPRPATGAEAPNAALSTAHTQTLGDRVGDRVLSRLREMCVTVEVGGLDFRTLTAPQG